MTTAERLIAVLVVVLLAGGLALGRGHGRHGATPDLRARAERLAARLPAIERRVEAIRGLRFTRPVRARVVTAAQSRREGLADLDRTFPVADRRATERILELLGLAPPGTDLRRVFGSVFGEQVAGYYDPRRKRLAIVAAPGSGGALDEITLAHELTHALEDQRFRLPQPPPGTDDGSTARDALTEGTATAVMAEYARRYLTPGDALQALGELGRAPQPHLPRYVQDSLEFPYTGGLRFVAALRSRAGGSWSAVDRAVRSRPPVSTEQILHPRVWPAERPLPVQLPAGPSGGWTRRAVGQLGEWDTREVLSQALSFPDASVAAAGWGGGRYALWTRRPPAGCAAPCRRAAVLLLDWRWDTRRDARQFAAALPAWLAKGLRARPAGVRRWRVGDGAAAMATGARRTALAFAPSAGGAARLAAAAAR